MAIFIATIVKSPKHFARNMSGKGKGGHRVAVCTSQTISLPLSKNAVRIRQKQCKIWPSTKNRNCSCMLQNVYTVHVLRQVKNHHSANLINLNEKQINLEMLF